MTIGGHAYDATLAGGARHVHVHEPGGLKVMGVSPDLPFSTIDRSIAFPYEVYTGEVVEFATSSGYLPEPVDPSVVFSQEIPMPLYDAPGLYAGVDPDQDVPEMTPLFGLLGVGVALSSIWYLIPDAQKRIVLTVLAGLGAVRGAPFAKSALLAGLRAKGPIGIAAAVLLGTLITGDTFTPDIDIPFIPSFPLPGLFGGNGTEPMPGAGGDAVGFAIAQHGPVVRSWVANGTPFYLFMDGWQAAQKRNGTWKFWKPKKPVVYVPGGPMSKRNARRLASIYNMEKKRAKKEFNLVDSRQGQGARVSKPTVIVETGPGSVNTR